ncbi:hypothetical protein BSQ39_11610 [Loigolactobacillus backii]|nr:hypothetical protein BSQ39_11610 [Loigolactobacillus backii]
MSDLKFSANSVLPLQNSAIKKIYSKIAPKKLASKTNFLGAIILLKFVFGLKLKIANKPSLNASIFLVFLKISSSVYL